MSTTTIGSLLRSSQAHCQQLCEKETLRYGIAFHCPAYPRLGEVNQYREVLLDGPHDAAAAWAEAEAFFAAQGLACLGVAPAMAQSPDPFDDVLRPAGFERREYAAFVLTQWPEGEPDPAVRVLPARAMRAAFRRTFEHDAVTPDPHAYADASESRLDDPPYDMFVATVDGQPVGRCALYQVGDLARVMELRTIAHPSEAAATDALLHHALGLARRLAMRNVIAQVDVRNHALLAAVRRAGFQDDGAIVEFQREAAKSR
jgi:RimJ/RimL family protein N-acetyltransferase